MTVKFIGGIADGKTVELDLDTEIIEIPVLMDGGLGRDVYVRDPILQPKYANSPVEFIAI